MNTQSQEKQTILRVAECYINTGITDDDQVKVISLPLDKTSYVEKIGTDGRIMMLDEYRLNGRVIRAAYSMRSNTVYLSLQSTSEIPTSQILSE